VAVEWGRRQQALRPAPLPAPLRSAVLRIVAAGYRAVPREAHPDAGGDHDAIVTATAARDVLVELLGAA
jgi:hypothetical protein